MAQECALSRRLSERVGAAEAEVALLRKELLESRQALSGKEEELEELRMTTNKWEVGGLTTPHTLTWSKRATEDVLPTGYQQVIPASVCARA